MLQRPVQNNFSQNNTKIVNKINYSNNVILPNNMHVYHYGAQINPIKHRITGDKPLTNKSAGYLCNQCISVLTSKICEACNSNNCTQLDELFMHIPKYVNIEHLIEAGTETGRYKFRDLIKCNISNLKDKIRILSLYSYDQPRTIIIHNKNITHCFYIVVMNKAYLYVPKHILIEIDDYNTFLFENRRIAINNDLKKIMY